MDISNASVGRSNNADVIQSQMQSLLKGLASYMTGTRYKAVISTIDSNWQGADADAFKSSFVKKVNQLQNELPKKYAQKYLASVQANISTFQAQQAKQGANLTIK